jgi:hypothetical protein
MWLVLGCPFSKPSPLIPAHLATDKSTYNGSNVKVIVVTLEVAD